MPIKQNTGTLAERLTKLLKEQDPHEGQTPNPFEKTKKASTESTIAPQEIVEPQNQ